MAINKERVALWAQDLETQDQIQTTGQLYSRRTPEQPGGDGGFCCLGRACEVYRANTGKGEWVPVSKTSPKYEFVTHDSKGCRCADAYALPKPVQEWYGLESSDPKLPETKSGTKMVCASSANDYNKWSFKRIAKALRQLVA